MIVSAICTMCITWLYQLMVCLLFRHGNEWNDCDVTVQLTTRRNVSSQQAGFLHVILEIKAKNSIQLTLTLMSGGDGFNFLAGGGGDVADDGGEGFESSKQLAVAAAATAGDAASGGAAAAVGGGAGAGDGGALLTTA